MATLPLQVQHLRQELQCSATLEHVSLHLRVCSLSIPWCGRQLRWQLLIPTAGGAPDVLFDDEDFRPLCCPPAAVPDARAAAASAVRTVLRTWSSTKTQIPTASPAKTDPDGRPMGHSQASQQQISRLSRLVSALLDAYRCHQVARLEEAAVRRQLSRLQFELSTLELGRGVQLELTAQQQARFALPLPPLDLRQLWEVLQLYGIAVEELLQYDSSNHQNRSTATSTAPGVRQQRGEGACSRSEGSCSSDDDDARDVLEPLEPGCEEEEALLVDLMMGQATVSGGGEGRRQQLHPQQQQRRRRRRQQHHAEGAGEGVKQDEEVVARGEELVFMLHAAFRLPSGAAAGDVGDPELTLQVPAALAALQSPPPPSPPAPATGTSTTPPAATASGSTSLTRAAAAAAVPLLPRPLLPPWSPDMCLAAYLPLAAERLQGQLEAHCGGLRARQQFLHHFCCSLLGPGGSPLELNLPAGTALLAVCWEGAGVLVGAELGGGFPREQPGISLQCARQLSYSDLSRTYRDYPWSPRWAPQEMAARIHNWLREELPNFLRGRPQQ
ncbi:hypothetical protein Agub_g918 [Astrephomene gubernaculifera]|uniref:BRISC and BRCA1-A complex member 2 n=1 Tax=Astrephomene gubernaculifera TaxID=47775 RepID=A0AAD3HHB2_9CHLO|nr:hypothetical protein Agub_g918 [Astrephomene gubernaculifera]